MAEPDPGAMELLTHGQHEPATTFVVVVPCDRRPRPLRPAGPGRTAQPAWDGTPRPEKRFGHAERGR